MSESLSEVAGLLSGAEPEPDAETRAVPDQAEATDESPEPAKGESEASELPATAATASETTGALTVKGMAEKLGLRPKDVYEQLMIDVGAGESLSLSAVKDAGAKLYKAEQILTDAETHVRTRENELLRRQNAINQRAPTEAEQAQADAHWSQFVRLENARTMGVISGWADPAVQRADLTEMSGLLTGYGFSGAEISRMADHRYVKAFYDLMTVNRRLGAARDAEVTKNPAPVGRGKRKSATKPGAKAAEQFKAGEISHSEAVAALIAGG